MYSVSKFIHDTHQGIYIQWVVMFSQLILPSVKELSFIQWICFERLYGLLIRVFFSIVKNYFMVALKMFCSFPDAQNDPKRYAIWLENVNQNSPVKFAPTKQSRICSEHFSLDMFEEGGVRVILKPYAVPTIFPHSRVCMCLHIFSIIDNACQVFYKPRAATV